MDPLRNMVVELLLVTCQAPPIWKHVARGVTKPTGRKKGKFATMRTWTLGSSLMPMITCPPKYQVLPTNIFSALDPHVVPWIVITFVDGCLTLDMECVEPDRDCLMDLEVESRSRFLCLAWSDLLCQLLLGFIHINYFLIAAFYFHLRIILKNITYRFTWQKHWIACSYFCFTKSELES